MSPILDAVAGAAIYAATAAGFHLTTTQIGLAGVLGAFTVPIVVALIQRSHRRDEDMAIRFIIQRTRSLEHRLAKYEGERDD